MSVTLLDAGTVKSQARDFINVATVIAGGAVTMGIKASGVWAVKRAS